MHAKALFAALALAALGACSKPTSTTLAATDSLQTPADAAKPAVVETLFVAPTPPPAPPREVRPAPPPPRRRNGEGAPPVAEGGRMLDPGTDIRTTLVDSIHSGFSGPGDPVEATVNADVSREGRVVIPAGSVITLRVNAIGPATSRGEKGTLDLVAESVRINGRSYPLRGSASDYDFEMKARKINAGDVVTAAGGAGIGALIGHVIGGKTGTIVGAIGGAAAGTAVAAKNADRDIIVHAGTPLTVSLLETFQR